MELLPALSAAPRTPSLWGMMPTDQWHAILMAAGSLWQWSQGFYKCKDNQPCCSLVPGKIVLHLRWGLEREREREREQYHNARQNHRDSRAHRQLPTQIRVGKESIYIHLQRQCHWEQEPKSLTIQDGRVQEALSPAIPNHMHSQRTA